jgi:membrane protein
VTEPTVADRSGRATRAARRPVDWVIGALLAFVNAIPRAIEDLFRDRCTQYAASIAYRVLFSLFPLTILLVSIFGLVLTDDELRERVIEELIAILPVSAEGEVDVQRSIEGIATPLSALGLLAFLALLWGASGMMASIRIGLEAALKIERGRPAVHAKLVDFLGVGISGLLVLVVVGLSAIGAFLGGLVDRVLERVGVNASPIDVLVRDGGLFLLLLLMTLLLYRYVPAARLKWRHAVVGAIVAAAGIWGATRVLAILDFSGYNLIYGSLAGVMTFLFFVYIVALILLFGAELAYALANPPPPELAGPSVKDRLGGFLVGLVVHRDEPARKADDESG